MRGGTQACCWTAFLSISITLKVSARGRKVLLSCTWLAPKFIGLNALCKLLISDVAKSSKSIIFQQLTCLNKYLQTTSWLSKDWRLWIFVDQGHEMLGPCQSQEAKGSSKLQTVALLLRFHTPHLWGTQRSERRGVAFSPMLTWSELALISVSGLA